VRERDWRDEATLWEATYAAVPDSPRASYHYGLVLTNRGEHAKAAELYRRSIAGDPTFVQAYFNLGSTYAGLGKIDEARNVYRSALKSDVAAAARTWHMTPEVLMATYRTELAMLDAQAGDTAGARDVLATIVAQVPNLIRAEDFYATVLQTRGETAAAVESWRARADAAPASVAERLVLANLFWKTGKVDEAYENLRRVVEIDNESALAHLLIARYYKEIRPAAAPSPTAAATHFARAYETAVTDFDRETVRRARGDAPSGSLAG
jgi:Tfp pilus assembly protein PilF